MITESHIPRAALRLKEPFCVLKIVGEDIVVLRAFSFPSSELLSLHGCVISDDNEVWEGKYKVFETFSAPIDSKIKNNV